MSKTLFSPRPYNGPKRRKDNKHHGGRRKKRKGSSTSSYPAISDIPDTGGEEEELPQPLHIPGRTVITVGQSEECREYLYVEEQTLLWVLNAGAVTVKKVDSSPSLCHSVSFNGLNQAILLGEETFQLEWDLKAGTDKALWFEDRDPTGSDDITNAGETDVEALVGAFAPEHKVPSPHAIMHYSVNSEASDDRHFTHVLLQDVTVVPGSESGTKKLIATVRPFAKEYGETDELEEGGLHQVVFYFQIPGKAIEDTAEDYAQTVAGDESPAVFTVNPGNTMKITAVDPGEDGDPWTDPRLQWNIEFDVISLAEAGKEWSVLQFGKSTPSVAKLKMDVFVRLWADGETFDISPPNALLGFAPKSYTASGGAATDCPTDGTETPEDCERKFHWIRITDAAYTPPDSSADPEVPPKVVFTVEQVPHHEQFEYYTALEAVACDTPSGSTEPCVSDARQPALFIDSFLAAGLAMLGLTAAQKLSEVYNPPKQSVWGMDSMITTACLLHYSSIKMAWGSLRGTAKICGTWCGPNYCNGQMPLSEEKCWNDELVTWSDVEYLAGQGGKEWEKNETDIPKLCRNADGTDVICELPEDDTDACCLVHDYCIYHQGCMHRTNHVHWTTENIPGISPIPGMKKCNIQMSKCVTNSKGGSGCGRCDGEKAGMAMYALSVVGKECGGGPCPADPSGTEYDRTCGLHDTGAHGDGTQSILFNVGCHDSCSATGTCTAVNDDTACKSCDFFSADQTACESLECIYTAGTGGGDSTCASSR